MVQDKGCIQKPLRQTVFHGVLEGKKVHHLIFNYGYRLPHNERQITNTIIFVTICLIMGHCISAQDHIICVTFVKHLCCYYYYYVVMMFTKEQQYCFKAKGQLAH